MFMSRFGFYIFNFIVEAVSRLEYYYFAFTKNYYKPFMKEVFGISYDSAKYEIKYLFIKDGNVISVFDPSNTDFNNTNPDIQLLPNSNAFDFIVYTYGYSNSILHRHSDLILDGPANQPVPVPSSGEVLFCDVEMNNKKLAIRLCRKEGYNFCMEGNIIDRKVIHYIVNRYFLEEARKTFEVEKIDLLHNPFKLHIIDNLVRFITIDQGDKIQFNKNNYVIIDSNGEETVMNVD